MIGGKELDLHVLYVEATKRGGFEKVNLFHIFFFFRFSSDSHLVKCKTSHQYLL